MINSLPLDEIKKHFYYDGEALRWARDVHPGSHKKAGDVAGSVSNTGYMRVGLKAASRKCMYMVHRLIYQLAHEIDNLPGGCIIDHMDRNPLNNLISNLRIASQSENNCNTNLRKDNSTGHKNIIIEARGSQGEPRSYRVSVQRNKKARISFHKNLEDAIRARDVLLAEMHGEFRSDGKVVEFDA